MSCVLSNRGSLLLVIGRQENAGWLYKRSLKEAERFFTPALMWKDKNASAHRGLGWVFEARGMMVEAGRKWSNGGFSALNFIAVGNWMGITGYRQALRWYERAAHIEPNLGDPWYHMGMLYEGQKRWLDALQAYERAVTLSTFRQTDRSSLYYRQGIIYQGKLERAYTDQAIVAFESAIREGAFRDSQEAADSYYRLGVLLRQKGLRPDAYVTNFEQAIERNPRYSRAYVLLGVTYYEMYKDVEMAERQIQKALTLNSKDHWSYLHLGDMYRDAGMCEASEMAYRQALEIDSNSELARNRLQAACEERGQ